KPGMAGTYAVALAEAAPRENGEALKHAAVEVRHKAQIVAIDVRSVLALIREPDLELARQVRLAIERIVFLLQAGGGLAIEPDLDIRPRARLEFTRKLPHVSL